jgi:hypothetical protein
MPLNYCPVPPPTGPKQETRLISNYLAAKSQTKPNKQEGTININKTPHIDPLFGFVALSSLWLRDYRVSSPLSPLSKFLLFLLCLDTYILLFHPDQSNPPHSHCS